MKKKDKKKSIELIYNEIKLHYGLQTDAELASFLGITAAGVSNSIARNAINWNNIFTKCEDMDFNYLRNIMDQNVQFSTNTHTNKYTQVIENHGKNTKKIIHKSKGFPLIPVEAMAGYGSGDVQVMDYDIQESYIITPELENKGVQYLIRASGSSMQPKYNNGDILACRPITDVTFMQWGKVYVLDTDQGPLVKRLYPCDPENDECLECRSDNFERYPPFKISKSSIRRVAIVVGVLRLE